MSKYVDFEVVVYNLKYTPQNINILIEDRQNLKWREYGIHNHGEILNMRNEADGDLWDIVIPAYNYRIPPNSIHKIEYIYGILWIENGNHKIFCSLKDLKNNPNRINSDIKKYINIYSKHLIKKNIDYYWIPYSYL